MPENWILCIRHNYIYQNIIMDKLYCCWACPIRSIKCIVQRVGGFGINELWKWGIVTSCWYLLKICTHVCFKSYLETYKSTLWGNCGEDPRHVQANLYWNESLKAISRPSATTSAEVGSGSDRCAILHATLLSESYEHNILSSADAGF